MDCLSGEASRGGDLWHRIAGALALIPAGSGPRAWRTAAAAVVWLGAAGAAAAQSTIDAEQLCKRTGRVRDAIVEAIAGATATCTDADPGADPPLTAHYETNITQSQLAGIETLDLKRRWPDEPHPLTGDFRPGDFDGLSGVRELWLYDSWQPRRRRGLAAMGVPADVLGRLEGLIFSNCGVSFFQSVDFFEGLSNLQELEIGLNNLTHELPGNPNRPEATLVAQIDPAVWRHLPNLRKLTIGRNRILTLSRGFFSHLTLLEELDMYDMWYEYHPYGFGSQALPGGIFEGLSNLRRLNLGYNAIGQTEVDDGLFDGLTSLEHLDLRDNPLLTLLPRSVLNLPVGVTIETDPGVKWPNRSPLPVGRLSSLSLAVEDGASSMDVSGVFTDPDADALTYGAMSSVLTVAAVAVSGSVVTVTPLLRGSSTVTVTATDVDGSNTSATQAFAVTVAENRSPEAEGTLPALSLQVADGARTLDVSGAFRDPDRDVLTYGASSSDVSVATAAATGSTVMVTPVSGGTVTVTVTATDVSGSNTTARQAFAVTVANRSPVRVGQLAPLPLVVEEGPATVDVSGAFTDPDADALTYGAMSSVVTVAAVAVSGRVVTVTPLSRGSSTVTVTATDVDGSNTSARQTFGVSVDGGGGGGGGGGGRNRGPEAVGTLEDRTLDPGAVEPVEVSPSFQDRDGDVLTYAAESSAPDVAAVAVTSSVVTVTPLAQGTATVTVTATDAEGSNRSATQTFTVTVVHDADGDGLISIHTLSQLDAVRYDLDGDGVPAAATASYAAAFGVTGAGRVSCGAGACSGYELGVDLTFDTNGSGVPDAGDAWWQGGAGWLPLGTAATPFTATFEGNGNVIRHLYMARGDGAGLFGATGTSGVVGHVGLTGVEVTGANAVGGLVGLNGGLVTGSYVTGRVSGDEAVGGLVGTNAGKGAIAGSYATAYVVGATSAGGLVGVNDGSVSAVYATGRVSATRRVGGLVGHNRGALTAGYTTGPVNGGAEAGGLVGTTELPGSVTAGYWDTDTSGRPAGSAGWGRPTSALQAPSDYAGLYAAWNVDVDGDGAVDEPWHFGTDAQYPALSLDVDSDGQATWQEMGRQLRAGPELSAAAPAVSPAQVLLTWTGADAGAGMPPPDTYTVTRESGAGLETVAAHVGGLRYVDRRVEPGAVYRYQVAAVVDRGEAARSAPVAAELPCTYTVTPLHRDVLWTAGTGQVAVTTGPTCAWRAASGSEFLTLTGGSSGRGSGTVTYTVAPNAGGPRTGALRVASQRVTVFQASPTVFTDHPIERGVTPVRAIHFLELRTRVDALRTRAGPARFRLDGSGADSRRHAGQGRPSDGASGGARGSLRRRRAAGSRLVGHDGDGRRDRHRSSAPDGAAIRRPRIGGSQPTGMIASPGAPSAVWLAARRHR